MRFNLTLLPLDAPSTLNDSAADVRAECDAAGLAYDATGTDTVIDAAWDELAPVLGRAEETLRMRHARVCMLLSVDALDSAPRRRGSAVVERSKHVPDRWHAKALRGFTAAMSHIRTVW